MVKELQPKRIVTTRVLNGDALAIVSTLYPFASFQFKKFWCCVVGALLKFVGSNATSNKVDVAKTITSCATSCPVDDRVTRRPRHHPA